MRLAAPEAPAPKPGGASTLRKAGLCTPPALGEPSPSSSPTIPPPPPPPPPRARPMRIGARVGGSDGSGTGSCMAALPLAAPPPLPAATADRRKWRLPSTSPSSTPKSSAASSSTLPTLATLVPDSWRPPKRSGDAPAATAAASNARTSFPADAALPPLLPSRAPGGPLGGRMCVRPADRGPTAGEGFALPAAGDPAAFFFAARGGVWNPLPPLLSPWLPGAKEGAAATDGAAVAAAVAAASRQGLCPRALRARCRLCACRAAPVLLLLLIPGTGLVPAAGARTGRAECSAGALGRWCVGGATRGAAAAPAPPLLPPPSPASPPELPSPPPPP
eukprot:56622-Chlamydomonas_euryale.AAC.2